ncbi:ABC transporter ATP-binding protein [Deinococcus oregonensis]|uniref:ABC transporter ATP-binding protein n=1 Tax=Deinococcus oregonensis TaxID=1805970 RepID=A0ABV6ATZ1_9DEIO
MTKDKKGLTDGVLTAAFHAGTPFATLVRLYRQEYGRLGLALLVYIVKHSPAWAMPLATANVINIISDPANHPIRELWWNGVILALLQLQNIPSNYWYVRLISGAIRRVELEVRVALNRQLQQLSIGYYTRASAGALQTKVLRDVEVLEQLTRQVFQEVPAILLTVVFVVIVTAVRAPWFLACFALLVPLAVLIVGWARTPIEDRNRNFRQAVERMSSRVADTIRMIPVARAHGVERDELAKVEDSLTEVRTAGLKLDSANALFGATAWVTFQSFNAACLILAGWAAYTDRFAITVGDVVLLTGYFATLTTSVQNLVNMTPLIARGLESVRSIGEVLESPDVEYNEGKIPVRRTKGHFQLEGVSFAYADGKEGVQDITLDIPSGQSLALVGPSGAGKSTLLNLLIGFIRPTRGRILLDGQDMTALDLRSFRQFVAAVPQETLLFDGTLRENVLYGARTVTEEQLQQALKDAHVTEFLMGLPEGLDTRLGERGARLSGGQKQRIAIARALVRNPRVLILDEATSALDSASEHLIQEALARLMRGRTTFIVAHRLSTIRGADRIVVMKDGCIVETGQHDALLSQQGVYAQLAGTQHVLASD